MLKTTLSVGSVATSIGGSVAATSDKPLALLALVLIVLIVMAPKIIRAAAASRAVQTDSPSNNEDNDVDKD